MPFLARPTREVPERNKSLILKTACSTARNFGLDLKHYQYLSQLFSFLWSSNLRKLLGDLFAIMAQVCTTDCAVTSTSTTFTISGVSASITNGICTGTCVLLLLLLLAIIRAQVHCCYYLLLLPAAHCSCLNTAIPIPKHPFFLPWLHH